jgi:hypothetical protein
MPQQGQGANERFDQSFDDLFGLIDTGISGANQWLVKNIRDTLFPGKFLRNNSNDFYCFAAQSPHWRKQGAKVKPIHIHYLLDAAYTANQTLVFDVFYAWVIPGTVFPALSGWTQLLGKTIVLSTSNLAQYYTNIFNLDTTDINPPSPEGYGTGLLVRIVRGNGTYSGDLGIFWSDAHAQKDRNGSFNEFSD